MSKRRLSIADLRTDLADRAFSRGANESTEQKRVGLEAEFFPIRTGRVGSPLAQVGREVVDGFSLFSLLDNLAADGQWRPGATSMEDGPSWTLSNEARVTIEPGGQVELSTPPRLTAEEALEEVASFEDFAAARLPEGYAFLSRGYNDLLGGSLPELVIQKPRYLAMDRHFAAIGPWGARMMRATASTQVNLDFGASPEESARRWRRSIDVASDITRFNGMWDDEELGHFARREIWEKTDPLRTGMPRGIEGSDPVEAYLQFALDASVIDERRESNDRTIQTGPSFRSLLAGPNHSTTLADWHDHLNLLFPDIRPRGFIEIRTLDALDRDRRREAVCEMVARCRQELSHIVALIFH